jgi:hypothetical protein
MKKLKPITRSVYADAEHFKYENARVSVISLEDSGYIIDFKVLSDNLTPKALHFVYKNKVVQTRIKLTDEAALAIYLGLKERFIKDNKLTNNGEA